MQQKAPLLRCKELLNELRSRPLNSSFLQPVDSTEEGFENYLNIITQPMDFSTVGSKLADGEYLTNAEWYNDVCLIYTNAMTFHPPDSLFYEVAKYNLAQFQNMALGLECSDTQQWYDLVNESMAELSRTIASGPVPQGTDPMILTILEQVSQYPVPAPESIEKMVKKLNEKSRDPIVRNDLLCLLRKTEPALKIEGEELTIDADSLSEDAKKVLFRYVLSRD
jgi:hypothetical protein